MKYVVKKVNMYFYYYTLSFFIISFYEISLRSTRLRHFDAASFIDDYFRKRELIHTRNIYCIVE